MATATLTLAQTGKQLIFNQALNKVDAGTTWKFHIFTNNVTPGFSDTVPTYTEDATAGYAAVDMSPASWTLSNPSGTIVKAQYPQIAETYTATNSATPAYGIFITDSTGTILIGAGLFSDGPYTLGSAGGIINVTVDLQIA